MIALERLTDEVARRMRSEIHQAGGSEVLFVGHVDPASRLVFEISVAARGNQDTVPALFPHMEKGDVVLHNHPSGHLVPSDADLRVASVLGNQAIGFYIVNNAVTDLYAVSEPVFTFVSQGLSAQETAAHICPGGSFDRLLSQFESRPSQVGLLKLFVQGFNEDAIVAAEAGTGVGKSFAYLIPSILWASKNKERVVVSTATINLQQQLFEKDIPLVQRALRTNVKAVLVKGRRNFLCPARLAEEVRDPHSDQSETTLQLQSIGEWAQLTKSGDVSELGFIPDESLWSRVCSDADSCHGFRCVQKESCFWAKSRKEAAGAGILVANHHLLFADLALRMNGFGAEATAVLPPFHRIVFDEAHHIEKSATSYFSAEVSRPIVSKILNRLYRKRKGRSAGIVLALQGLGTDQIDFAQFPVLIEKMNETLDAFTTKALATLGGQSSFRFVGSEGSRAMDQLVDSLIELQKPMMQLSSLCLKLGEVWEEENEVPPEAFEIKTLSRKLDGLSQVVDRCKKFELDSENVYWLDRIRDGFGNVHVQLVISPLTIDRLMTKAVYEPYRTVLMTSATLAVRGEFGFWASRVGFSFVDKDRQLQGIFPSPFDYKNRVLLASPVDFPLPDSPEYKERLESFLPPLIRASGGSALVLFTSYESMKQAYAAVQPVLAEEGISVYRQGDEERGKLLARFKTEITSVLFATDSFWEGVDSPGDTLRQVIICRLPFRVPSDPILAARMEDLERRGFDSFMNFSLPEAVTRFKQGFGRLVRHTEDWGTVVVLDTRLVRKAYGSHFLQSIPETQRAMVPAQKLLDEVKSFLRVRQSAKA